MGDPAIQTPPDPDPPADVDAPPAEGDVAYDAAELDAVPVDDRGYVSGLMSERRSVLGRVCNDIFTEDRRAARLADIDAELARFDVTAPGAASKPKGRGRK